MIEPVLVFMTKADNSREDIMIFHTELDRIQDGEIIPTDRVFAPLDFILWCEDRGLRLTWENSPLTRCSTGTVRFNTEDERFEFKIRWGV